MNLDLYIEDLHARKSLLTHELFGLNLDEGVDPSKRSAVLAQKKAVDEKIRVLSNLLSARQLDREELAAFSEKIGDKKTAEQCFAEALRFEEQVKALAEQSGEFARADEKRHQALDDGKTDQELEADKVRRLLVQQEHLNNLLLYANNLGSVPMQERIRAEGDENWLELEALQRKRREAHLNSGRHRPKVRQEAVPSEVLLNSSLVKPKAGQEPVPACDSGLKDRLKTAAASLGVGAGSAFVTRIGAQFALAKLFTTVPALAFFSGAPVVMAVLTTVAACALAGGAANLLVTSCFGNKEDKQGRWIWRSLLMKGGAAGGIGGNVSSITSLFAPAPIGLLVSAGVGSVSGALTGLYNTWVVEKKRSARDMAWAVAYGAGAGLIGGLGGSIIGGWFKEHVMDVLLTGKGSVTNLIGGGQKVPAQDPFTGPPADNKVLPGLNPFGDPLDLKNEFPNLNPFDNPSDYGSSLPDFDAEAAKGAGKPAIIPEHQDDESSTGGGRDDYDQPYEAQAGQSDDSEDYIDYREKAGAPTENAHAKLKSDFVINKCHFANYPEKLEQANAQSRYEFYRKLNAAIRVFKR